MGRGEFQIIDIVYYKKLLLFGIGISQSLIHKFSFQVPTDNIATLRVFLVRVK